MITLEQLNTALSNAGLAIDAVTGQCVVDMVNGYEQCLIDAGLSECEVMIAMLIAAQYVSTNMGGRVVKSQGVKGISISYEQSKIGELQQQYYNQLVQMGALECMKKIIPVPANAKYGFAFSASVCS